MGTEFEKDNIIDTSPEDEDLLLPDGYGAGDDLFADPSTWPGKQADEPASQTGDGEDGKGDGAEEAPTTAQETAQDVTGSDNAEAPTTEPTAPTTAQETAGTAPNMLKFRAKIDHNEQDVELNESDLPGIWQKAQNHDRMQSRLAQQQAQLAGVEQLAKSLGYATVQEMVEKAANAYRDSEVKNLMDTEGVSERVAKAIVEQEMRGRSAAPAQSAAPAPTQAAPARDAKAEVDQLLAVKPELRGKQMPPEVISAWTDGKNLLQAYTEYEAEKSRSEAERLRAENNIHKQNAANAAKAPVKSVSSGGATNNKGEDDFMKGFNSDY